RGILVFCPWLEALPPGRASRVACGFIAWSATFAPAPVKTPSALGAFWQKASRPRGPADCKALPPARQWLVVASCALPTIEAAASCAGLGAERETIRGYEYRLRRRPGPATAASAGSALPAGAQHQGSPRPP